MTLIEQEPVGMPHPEEALVNPDQLHVGTEPSLVDADPVAEAEAITKSAAKNRHGKEGKPEKSAVSDYIEKLEPLFNDIDQLTPEEQVHMAELTYTLGLARDRFKPSNEDSIEGLLVAKQVLDQNVEEYGQKYGADFAQGLIDRINEAMNGSYVPERTPIKTTDRRAAAKRDDFNDLIRVPWRENKYDKLKEPAIRPPKSSKEAQELPKRLPKRRPVANKSEDYPNGIPQHLKDVMDRAGIKYVDAKDEELPTRTPKTPGELYGEGKPVQLEKLKERAPELVYDAAFEAELHKAREGHKADAKLNSFMQEAANEPAAEADAAWREDALEDYWSEPYDKLPPSLQSYLKSRLTAATGWKPVDKDLTPLRVKEFFPDDESPEAAKLRLEKERKIGDQATKATLGRKIRGILGKE